MPGVKNPMCNTFPRWMPVNVRIRIISFSELPLVTTGGGDLGADRRTSTQYVFWVSIILMIRFDSPGHILSLTNNYQVFLLLWWWCLVVAFIGFLRLIWRAAQCRSDGFPVEMMRPTLI